MAPDYPEILLELARLLANSLSDRNREAVIVYEKARKLGQAPDPALEKKLGSLLDDRRQLVSFMAAAAREAEVNNDWSSAVWYYKKIMEDNHPEYFPLLAFAQWKSGSSAAARETLEFNSPSRNGMVVLTLISLAEKDFGNAVRAAQQSAGAKIPADWVGINVELNKIRKKKELSAAEQILMKSLQ